MKSDNVEKYIETVERKVDSRQEKFSELYKKFTVAENKLSELEKVLHEDHFTRLLDKEWEKRKVLLAKEFEKKHTILNDTVDNELKNFYEKIRDVFQQINIHKKDYDDKLKERGNFQNLTKYVVSLLTIYFAFQKQLFKLDIVL